MSTYQSLKMFLSRGSKVSLVSPEYNTLKKKFKICNTHPGIPFLIIMQLQIGLKEKD